MHKDHLTAFKALATSQEKGINDYSIVCTGSKTDYRLINLNYIDKLNI